jgi:hypothetical protein
LTGRRERYLLTSLMITSRDRFNVSYPSKGISKVIHELQKLQRNISVEYIYSVNKFLPYRNRSLRDAHERYNSGKMASFYYYLLITQNSKIRDEEIVKKKSHNIWKGLFKSGGKLQ